LCNSCASLAGLDLSFIACFILLVIAPLVLSPFCCCCCCCRRCCSCCHSLSGLFRNLRRGDPGIHFTCTFSNVFKFSHNFFFTLIVAQFFSPPNGEPGARPPKCAPSLTVVVVAAAAAAIYCLRSISTFLKR